MSTDHNTQGILQAVRSDTYAEDLTFRAMINDIILTYFNSDECKHFYGYLYGSPWYINVNRDGREVRKSDRLLRIEKSGILVSKDNDALIYIWGYPGPDANIYEFKDYGITWAFSEEDIIHMTAEEYKEWLEKNR